MNFTKYIVKYLALVAIIKVISIDVEDDTIYSDAQFRQMLHKTSFKKEK